MKSKQSDRELLELAAKALGYDTSHPMNRERLSLNPPVNALWVSKGGELVHTAWDPLEDDGLALRLAVKLGLDVEMHGCNTVHPYACAFDCERNIAEEVQPDDGDPDAATRRAIVRAAAAIAEGA